MHENTTSRLTRREWYAALLFAHGATSNEAANALLVRPSTAEQLVRAARGKLKVTSRSEIRRTLAA
jgi:DNA-binding CsgD family transcriptional regulator